MRCGSRASWSVSALLSRDCTRRVSHCLLRVGNCASLACIRHARCSEVHHMHMPSYTRVPMRAYMQAPISRQHAQCACAGGVAVIFDKQQLILLEDCQEMMVRACSKAWCSCPHMRQTMCNKDMEDHNLARF